MRVEVAGLFEGLMVYWDEVKGASRYYVHLSIGKWNENLRPPRVEYQEIKQVECDRHTKTYSFLGLARINRYLPNYIETGRETGLNYYVYVESENKDGNIIEKSEMTMARVLTFRDGYCIE